MIEWPREEKLDGLAKQNVDRFKSTAAALELEEDTASWRLVAWARTDEPPMRMILRNDQTKEEVTFTLDRTGTWLLRRPA